MLITMPVLTFSVALKGTNFGMKTFTHTNQDRHSLHQAPRMIAARKSVPPVLAQTDRTLSPAWPWTTNLELSMVLAPAIARISVELSPLLPPWNLGKNERRKTRPGLTVTA